MEIEMYGSRRVRVALAVIVVTVCTAGEAAAQVCMGFPTARGQGAVAANANFPTGGSDFGVEAGYFLPVGISIFGGAQVISPDQGDNVTSFGGGASYSLPEMLAVLPTGLYACPFASVYMTSGDNDAVRVPVGMGFATILSLGESMALSPFIQPQFRWTSVDDDSKIEWLLSGGANVIGFLGPRLYAGFVVNRVFVDDTESVFGVKVGLTF